MAGGVSVAERHLCVAAADLMMCGHALLGLQCDDAPCEQLPTHAQGNFVSCLFADGKS